MKWNARLFFLLIFGWITVSPSQEAFIPPKDRRAVEIRHLNMAYAFQPYNSREEWLARAKDLREQILVSTGLWPPPERTPLNAEIFGKIERGDYSIEKVYFESYPGFYVTGNLYRPLRKTGPFPGIVSPHGHWTYGRLENQPLGSIPGRCINFARQGYVIFSYDMVGYNDSRQVDHRLIGKPLSLWGIGSLALHLWNSIRAVDFLESLPDVDKTRLAATGASGGGTQTFLLTAVDDRIKVSAPVNMISHYMQGGDVCENIANLRIDTNNMEIGAMMAPRPLLMVSAAGDWTRDTPRVEFPAIQSVYKLLGAEDKVQTVQFFAEHNYNKDSREAVYAWFGRWLLGKTDASPFRERSFSVPSPADMLVFYGRPLPPNAKTEAQLIEYLIQSSERQLQSLKPRDGQSLNDFRKRMAPALRHALAAEYPEARNVLEYRMPDTMTAEAGLGAGQAVLLGRRGRGDRVPGTLWKPKSSTRSSAVTLLVHAEGTARLWGEDADLVRSLVRAGHTVLSIDAFNTGSAKAARDMTDRFFTTYNRTDDALRVQDILTALAYLRKDAGTARVQLVGFGRAGLWGLLARALAPELERAVVDVDRFESGNDQAYLDSLYTPVIRRAGDFRTAVTLAPATRLLIHNTGGRFETDWAQNAYRAAQAESQLRVETAKLSPAEILAALK